MCVVDDGLACVSSSDSAGGLNLTKKKRVETSAVNFQAGSLRSASEESN